SITQPLKVVPRILVIDDDWLNRDLLQAYITSAGYECEKASSGADGLELARARPPDLVLCDVQMRGMNGYEVCERLKADPATQFVPVVMVTALDAEEEKLHAIEVGADDFVTKPYNPVLLLKRVESLLRIKLLHDQVEARNRLLRQVLTRYMSAEVTETILTDPERYLKLGGETRPVAVLFADIRGFTRYTELQTAERVVETLNEIFSELTRVVFDYGGTFDKYLGDEIMAFWGAPLAGPDDVRNAVRATVAMRDTFADMCARRGDMLADLGLGIGLHCGDATVGNVGSEKVMDYTVIGDTVNVASRLQEAAGPGQILISVQSYRQVADEVEAVELDALHLAGRTDPVAVYEVRGLAG
ncbi:MAG: response regulator, partial [Anaerolineales bacterium]